jgi:hypothetical protein
LPVAKYKYIEGSPTKICGRCDTEKPIEEFVLSKRCVGGRSHTCRECCRKYNKERRRKRNQDEDYVKERNRLKEERKARRLEESKKIGPRSKGGKYTYIDGSPTKICSKCDIEKPLEAFPKNVLCAGGVTGVCKQCNNTRQEAWRRKAMQEREDFRKRRYRSQDKARAKKYGITVEQLDKMQEESGGVCEICSQPPDSGGRTSSKTLHIDHCHTTGQVRGLLCSRCNLCLGQIEENPKLIVEMLLYLDKYKRRTSECSNTC